MEVITHPGDAHVDDFLSTSLVVYIEDIEGVHRREPTESELRDKNMWKLDIGGDHRPEDLLFDHHGEAMDDCTLTLLLKHWGVYEEAVEAHPWIETTAAIDNWGPITMLQRFELPYHALTRLASFVEKSVLLLFQGRSYIEKGCCLFRLMEKIGENFFEEIRRYSEVSAVVDSSAELFLVDTVPVIMCLDAEPSKTLDHVLNLRRREEWGAGGIAVYQTNRPVGSVALKRYDNDQRVDFNRVEGLEGVLFVHKTGFFAVVEAVTRDRLKEYIEAAIRI